MRRFTWGVVALVAVSVGGATLATLAADKEEPKVQGKTVSEWVGALQSAPRAKDRAAAAMGLAAFGPKAKEAVGPLVAALKSDEAMVRYYAAEALTKIGPAAVPQ